MCRFTGKYTPSPEDAVAAYRMHHRTSQNETRLQIFGGVLMLLVFGVIGLVMDFPVIIGLGIALSPLFFLASWYGDWSVRRLAAKGSVDEVAFEISDLGISCVSKNWRNEHSWAPVMKCRIDHRGVVVYTDDDSYQFFPARAFDSGFSLEQIRALLESKVKSSRR